jgi:hypothetical protein
MVAGEEDGDRSCLEAGRLPTAELRKGCPKGLVLLAGGVCGHCQPQLDGVADWPMNGGQASVWRRPRSKRLV